MGGGRVMHGEGNGTPLQYSCLENHRYGGAWWASVYGVAQSWTRLKRLSSRVMQGQQSLILIEARLSFCKLIIWKSFR